MDKTYDTISQFRSWFIALHRKHAGVDIMISSDKDDNGNKIARIVLDDSATNWKTNLKKAKKDVIATLVDHGVEEYVVAGQTQAKCLILVAQDRDVDSIVFDMSCYYIPKKKNKVDFSGMDDLKSFLKKNRIDFDVEDYEKDGVSLTINKKQKASHLISSVNFSWNAKGKFISIDQP